MQEITQSRPRQTAEVQEHDPHMPREDQRILATMPSRTSLERYGVDGAHPEVYRQALKAILATPEFESRLNFTTASLIVTIFGSWLAGKLIHARAFLIFVDVVLFFVSLAIAGLLIGVMVGENVLPAEIIPILLFAVTGIVLLVVGFVFGNMLVGVSRSAPAAVPDASHRRGAVVSVKPRGTHYDRATERSVYAPRSHR